MIKDFKNFVKESVENKGKGPGNQDLMPSAPKKQTINRSIPTMDFLRIGKHIKTNKIDGFIDSVQNENIYISDRITGEITKYSLKEILKEITKPKKINEGLEQRINQVQTIDTDENEITHEDQIDNIDDDEDDEVVDIDELDEDVYYDKGELVGDTYNPGLQSDDDDIDIDIVETSPSKEKEEWYEGDEEEYQEQNRFRGTEDNPISRRNNESWIKYWEKFNKNQIEVIEDLEEDDVIDEYEENEEEVPHIGNEANPIESRKRTKIEEYSEENPEPLPNDVANDDDRHDQFVKK